MRGRDPIDMSALINSESRKNRIDKLHEDRIDEIIAVHYLAFDGYLNTKLGDDYLKEFFKWFITSSCAISLGAYDSSDQLTGYVIGAPLGYEILLNKKIFKPAALRIITHPWLLFNIRILRAIYSRFRLNKKTKPNSLKLPEPVMSLVGIAVHPESQGNKIGIHLIQAFEEKAFTLPMKALRLSVYPENQIARRLYESSGWQAFSESVMPGQAMYYFKLLE